MRRYIELGPAPANEPCAQLGSDDYYERMRQETSRYIKLLRKMFPNRPEGCDFVRKGFNHDFGVYHEVVVTYDEDVEEQVKFAFEVENNLPGDWPVCDHRPIKIAEHNVKLNMSETKCEDCGAVL